MSHLCNVVDDWMLIEMYKVMCLVVYAMQMVLLALSFLLVHPANLQHHVIVVYKTSGIRRQRF